jgi:C-terminal processing protease CtpA/Prc
MTPISPTPKQRTEILAAVKKSVLKNHFNVAGVDYNDWARRFDERSPTLLGVDLEGFEDGVRKALAELGSSHTVFYHERTNRLLPQHSINATLRAFEHDGQQRWHFLDIFEGGPADVAGIKRGDMLVAVDGIPYAPPAMPPFRIGETHRITVSTGLGEQSREIAVSVPFRKGTKNRPPIVEPRSPTHEVVAPKTGLLKIPYFPGSTGISFANALDLAIRDLKSQGCDRLIVDLRGNIGGSLGFARLASYLCPGQVPIGHSLTPTRFRKGYTREGLPRVPMPRTTAEFVLALARFALRDKSVVLLTQGLGPQPFHGRVVILVNEWTNSAAEMLAGGGAKRIRRPVKRTWWKVLLQYPQATDDLCERCCGSGVVPTSPEEERRLRGGTQSSRQPRPAPHTPTAREIAAQGDYDRIIARERERDQAIERWAAGRESFPNHVPRKVGGFLKEHTIAFVFGSRGSEQVERSFAKLRLSSSFFPFDARHQIAHVSGPAGGFIVVWVQLCQTADVEQHLRRWFEDAGAEYGNVEFLSTPPNRLGPGYRILDTFGM